MTRAAVPALRVRLRRMRSLPHAAKSMTRATISVKRVLREIVAIENLRIALWGSVQSVRRELNLYVNTSRSAIPKRSGEAVVTHTTGPARSAAVVSAKSRAKTTVISEALMIYIAVGVLAVAMCLATLLVTKVPALVMLGSSLATAVL